MNIEKQLLELYEKYESELDEYVWAFENTRWTELIFCLLNQFADDDPEIVRQAVDTLDYLDLLEIDSLICLENADDEKTVTITLILKQHGFTKKNAQRATKLLCGVAKAVHNRFDGKIQKCLRRNGIKIRDELVKEFRNKSISEDKLRYAVSHWLQNTFNLPISLEHRAVIEYCKKHKITLEELLEIADNVGLNVALLDDLLEIEGLSQESVGVKQRKKEEKS